MSRALLILLLLLGSLGWAQTVCIDPGHPSEVGEGTRGKRITEMKAAWKVALLLKAKLEAKGVKVVLTKQTEKQYVKNRDRAEAANKVNADLMVRLHCDSAGGSGFATYYPARQGTAQGRTGPSEKVIAMSKAAAKVFHAQLAAGLKGVLRNNGLKTDMQTKVGADNGGALIGSIFSEVPVVLVEMCVLTNDSDDRFMSSTEGQERFAQALCDATLAVVRK